MLRNDLITERPEPARSNRKIESRVRVRPAILASPGKPRGVAVRFAGSIYFLTEAGARTLADALHDVLDAQEGTP